jgi:hypothetical protein
MIHFRMKNSIVNLEYFERLHLHPYCLLLANYDENIGLSGSLSDISDKILCHKLRTNMVY